MTTSRTQNDTLLSDTFALAKPIVAIIPAAGAGRRMGTHIPKQYLTIGEKTVLEHTATQLLAHPLIEELIIVISKDDPYFTQTTLAHHPKIKTAIGGQERADSVLAGLNATDAHWVMVHDAARPCVRLEDIDQLIKHALSSKDGAILASPVRDTMKRATTAQCIQHTESREQLWHALTPQMFQRADLQYCLTTALLKNAQITDEASAMEFMGKSPLLVQGHSDNIKITLQEDLPLATFLLSQQANKVTQ